MASDREKQQAEYRKYLPFDDTLFDYVQANTTPPDASMCVKRRRGRTNRDGTLRSELSQVLWMSSSGMASEASDC